MDHRVDFISRVLDDLAYLRGARFTLDEIAIRVLRAAAKLGRSGSRGVEDAGTLSLIMRSGANDLEPISKLLEHDA